MTPTKRAHYARLSAFVVMVGVTVAEFAMACRDREVAWWLSIPLFVWSTNAVLEFRRPVRFRSAWAIALAAAYALVTVCDVLRVQALLAAINAIAVIAWLVVYLCDRKPICDCFVCGGKRRRESPGCEYRDHHCDLCHARGICTGQCPGGQS